MVTNDKYNEVKDYIESFNYKLISTNYSYKEKLIIQCDKGHIYQAKYGVFRTGRRCPHCNPQRKKSYDEVKNFVKDIGYDLLTSNYINSDAPITVKCDKGHIYNTSYHALKRGRRCANCKKENDEKKAIENKSGVEKFNKLSLEYNFVKSNIESCGYILLSSNYKNYQAKLEIQCDKGHIYKANYGHFKRGNRCPICRENKKRTYDEVKFHIESCGYKLLSTEMPFAKTKLEIQCNKGHIYKTTYGNFMYGNRCPHCKLSKGEEAIKLYLKEQNIKFKHQYAFDDCRDKNILRFDFAILDKENNLQCLIEYDGIQHFYPFKHFGGKKKFLETKKRDMIKNNYCQFNNIRLVRIPYTMLNKIPEILKVEIA